MSHTHDDFARPVPGFPSYEVTRAGDVFNTETGNRLRISYNRLSNYVFVTLSRNNVRTTRGLALLVATAFCLRGLNEHHDTPITINGDVRDCRLENLAMRTRAFAIKFGEQIEFEEPIVKRHILEPATGLIWDNSRDLAFTYGLLESDIYASIQNMTYVMPTGQVFQYA